MTARSKVWYLRYLDLFSALTDDEVEEIAQMLGDHRIPSGVELVDERCHDDICIIKEGAVRVHADDARHPTTLAILGPGKVFRPSSRAGDRSSLTHATTLLPSYVCFASWSQMMDIALRYPQMVVGLIQSLADLVIRAESWRARVGMPSPCHRLTHLLGELGNEFGEPTAAGRRLPFPLTQADLGHVTGLSRETVSRLMADFVRQGWVTREETLLVVRDPDVPPACRDTATHTNQ